MTRRGVLIVMSVALLPALAACGSISPADQARKTAKQTIADFFAGRAEQVCARLSTQARSQLPAALRSLGAHAVRSCPADVAMLRAVVLRRAGGTPEHWTWHESGRVDGAQAHSQGETVVLTASAGDSITLREQGSRWVVTAVNLHTSK